MRIREFCYLFFVDIEKAFDSIDHTILIKRCEQMKMDEADIEFIKWYLNQMAVNIGKNRVLVNKGGPQGGTLSPFLWLIYIDSLLVELGQIVGDDKVLAYADDIVCICETAELVREVKACMDRWAWLNKVTINYASEKSEVM